MRKTKIETEVLACEICGKGIRPTEDPLVIRGNTESESYFFHRDCANDLLVKAAKGEIKTK